MIARERLSCLRENLLRSVPALCFHGNLDVFYEIMSRTVQCSRGFDDILHGLVASLIRVVSGFIARSTATAWIFADWQPTFAAISIPSGEMVIFLTLKDS